MKIPTGIDIKLGHIGIAASIDLPHEEFYDFPIFGILLHECEHDYTLNLTLIGFRLQLSWIKEP